MTGLKFLATCTHTRLSFMGLTSFGLRVQNIEALRYESISLPRVRRLRAPPACRRTPYFSLSVLSYFSYARVHPSSVNASRTAPASENLTLTARAAPPSVSTAPSPSSESSARAIELAPAPPRPAAASNGGQGFITT